MPAIEKQIIKKKKNNKVVLTILSIILLISIIYLIILSFDNKEELNEVVSDSVCYTEEIRIIKGTSMFPFFNNDDQVTELRGYYECNEIEKGDMVVFNFKTRKGDYIKRLVAMENDVLEFENDFIKINGEFVLNSENNKYKLNQAGQKILSIPLKDNIIQKNSYLVLGDNISNSVFDSRQFGFISKKQIISKIIK